MKSSLLSSYSSYGKFIVKTQDNASHLKSINLKQHYSHERPFQAVKFDIAGEKIYLLDSVGELINLSLTDNSFSTLKGHKISNFTIDGMNSFNLLLANKKSELIKVNFENKQSTKIMNLNMSKILAFERNYLREMIMVLDYKLLFLCDLTNSSKIKSLKANYNEVFTNACFASQNRFIVLAVKNIEIRILEVYNLKKLHSITLPFEVKNLKIQVSYDCKTIAIYGDCNIIFFITIDQSMSLTYQLVEFQYFKTVKQLKFTYENEIMILGSDQIIYAISPQNYNRLVPVFNSDDHLRLMAFDLSLDCQKLVVVSNRTVFTLHWKNGIKGAMRECQKFKEIQFSKQKIDNLRNQNDEFQYDDEDDENFDSLNEKSKIKNVGKSQYELKAFSNNKLINIPEMKTKLNENIHAEIQDLDIQYEKKCYIQQIFKFIYENFSQSELLQTHKKGIVTFILTVLTFSNNNPYKAVQICYFILQKIIENAQTDNIEKFSLLFAPQIVAAVEKELSINFYEFFIQNVITLFAKYLKQTELFFAINAILQNSNRHEFVVLFFIQMMKELHQQNSEWMKKNRDNHSIDIKQIAEATKQKFLLKKNEYIFAKPHEFSKDKYLQDSLTQLQIQNIKHKNQETLEELILKQERIKKAIAQIRRLE